MIETAVGILTVPDLEATVALNLDLAERYQAIADDPDLEPEARQIAAALAAWCRARSRYFREEAPRQLRGHARLETSIA